MENDKICHKCGGLMLYVIKGNFKAHFCIECGNIEIIDEITFW